MIVAEERYELNGREVVLRCPRAEDAEMLIEYLKLVTGETRFLFCESDEVEYTTESEQEFLNEHNEAEDALLLLAFVDGEHAGNCSFNSKGGASRRAKHRAEVGIALRQKFTGFGLGRLMMESLMKHVEAAGYEQAELVVVESNDRAYHLYETLGFKECGRIPNGNKYDDGTYLDDIFMVKKF